MWYTRQQKSAVDLKNWCITYRIYNVLYQIKFGKKGVEKQLEDSKAVLSKNFHNV